MRGAELLAIIRNFGLASVRDLFLKGSFNSVGNALPGATAQDFCNRLRREAFPSFELGDGAVTLANAGFDILGVHSRKHELVSDGS